MNPSHAPWERLLLREAVIEHMSDHMHQRLPEEACGVLIGHADEARRSITVTQFIPVKNTADNPLHSFHLDPLQWTRLVLTEKGIVGLFHSHPHTTPEPSGEDLLQLQSFGGLLRVYAIASPVVPGATGLNALQLQAYKITRSEEDRESFIQLPPSPWSLPGRAFYSLAPIPFTILKE
ncbi:Mov34/MPN/PAD-1 family [Actinobacillus pleuropneumoniae]|nr:Mov34/MPN/PAD-1 family [Actinobacillus pleuropneumoniae]